MYKPFEAELERMRRHDVGKADRPDPSLWWHEAPPASNDHSTRRADTHRGHYLIDTRPADGGGYNAFAYFFEHTGAGLFIGFEHNRFFAPMLAAQDKCLKHANAQPPYPPILAWPADCGIGLWGEVDL